MNSEENKNLKVPAVLFMILLCVFGVCAKILYPHTVSRFL